MPNRLPTINLVKKEKKPFLDTFLHWALTIGRVVVMLTEIIALSTFLYRFSLDRQIIDLHDKIKQKQTIVTLLKENEYRYRNFQNRLAVASQLDTLLLKPSAIFMDIYALTPADVSLNTITVSENGLKIDANAQSLTALTSFINKLNSYPKTNTVNLNKIENRISNATLGVSLSLTLKK